MKKQKDPINPVKNDSGFFVRVLCLVGNVRCDGITQEIDDGDNAVEIRQMVSGTAPGKYFAWRRARTRFCRERVSGRADSIIKKLTGNVNSERV
jgi:hypothetical protein